MSGLALKRVIVYASAVLCIAACLADLLLIYLFGLQIPGYNQLTSTLSSLGISSSPVASEVTTWSVILGGIFILFAYGFRGTFRFPGKETRTAAWLIVIYGLGECIASGVFRADRINGELTNMALLHDFLGGAGVVALLWLPLVMRKIFSNFSYPLFFRFSGLVMATGLLSTLLFSFRLEYFANTLLHKYCGLWQRIFLADYYLYFIVISFMMLKSHHQRTPHLV